MKAGEDFMWDDVKKAKTSAVNNNSNSGIRNKPYDNYSPERVSNNKDEGVK